LTVHIYKGKSAMTDVMIRKFKHTDVDDFIRLSQISFSDESLAAGITPEDFENETRRIFRWKMIPYKLLAALMGVKWEAFVAEKDGKVVGGGMYIGRNNRMTITNLMVDPEYRRQGIGQALLVKRLERLTERGFPYVTAQVLETNTASLENLKKQNFEVFNQYSTYERALPLHESRDSTTPPVTAREITRSDRASFEEMERQITSPYFLYVKGSTESEYFQSGWLKLYARFTGNSVWITAFEVQGKTIGYINVRTHHRQYKGYLNPPVVSDEHLQHLQAMIHTAGAWLAELGKESMVIEIPDGRTQIRDYLLDSGWTKQYTWVELIKWLGESAGQKFREL
jgi:ribosomal protein S18 acetylase RimI-like enzyme